VQKDVSKQRVDFSKITVFDVILIASILLLSAGILLRTKLNLDRKPSAAMGASVYHDGKLHDRLALDTDRELVLLNGKMLIEVKGKKLRVKKSECPRQLCVKTGWIQYTGETIVCVPFKTLIEINSGDTPVVDAVVF